jgi:tetratricopeptide (TPR) repeat protein
LNTRGPKGFNIHDLSPDRAVSVSNALYNRGLALAQSGRVSDAIEALEHALEFCKLNTSARNVLGLCYYHAGRLGEALGHWLLSITFDKDYNPASEYIEHTRIDYRQTNKINQSLNIYNQSLDYYRSGNVDMAILSLKKCVELNPGFTDALCLLALGYMSAEQNKKAEPLVRRVLQIDPSNPQAMAYYAEITGGITPPPKTRGSKRPALLDVRGYAKPDNKRNIVQDFKLSEILSFIIGCLIIAAVYHLLVMPDRERELREEVANANELISIARAAGDIALELRSEEYRDIDTYIAFLESEWGEARAKLDLMNRINALEEGQEFFAARDYLMSYSRMTETSTEGFTAQQTLLHSQIMRDSSAAIEAGFFRDGKSEFDRRRYAEARWYLEQAEKFTVPDSPTADQMYYMLGRIAEEFGETDLAIYHYNTVAARYPTSTHHRDASNRLGRLRN